MKKNEEGHDKNLNRNFKFRFPFYAEKAVSSKEIDSFTLLVTLENGSRILYDDLEGTMEHISENPTDAQWKRSFGRRLYRRIISQGLTQKELSEKSGLSIITISQYVNGRTTPSFQNVFRLAKVLGCTVNDLVPYDYD